MDPIVVLLALNKLVGNVQFNDLIFCNSLSKQPGLLKSKKNINGHANVFKAQIYFSSLLKVDTLVLQDFNFCAK